MICIKTQAKESRVTRAEMVLKERLPTHIAPDCCVSYCLETKQQGAYYLLDLTLKANLTVTCQRCLSDFPYEYHHQSQLAICDDDAVAERLMSEFDCIVAPQYQLDLQTLLVDELHLHAPERHLESSHCDPGVLDFMNYQSTLLDCQ
jgi:uncharacterized protein